MSRGKWSLSFGDRYLYYCHRTVIHTVTHHLQTVAMHVIPNGNIKSQKIGGNLGGGNVTEALGECKSLESLELCSQMDHIVL